MNARTLAAAVVGLFLGALVAVLGVAVGLDISAGRPQVPAPAAPRPAAIPQPEPVGRYTFKADDMSIIRFDSMTGKAWVLDLQSKVCAEIDFEPTGRLKIVKK